MLNKGGREKETDMVNCMQKCVPFSFGSVLAHFLHESVILIAPRAVVSQMMKDPLSLIEDKTLANEVHQVYMYVTL